MSGMYTSSSSDSINKFYVHDQNIPSKTWIIEHQLNKFPSVTVVDSAHGVVFADIVYRNNTTIVVDFSTPCTGTVYLN